MQLLGQFRAAAILQADVDARIGRAPVAQETGQVALDELRTGADLEQSALAAGEVAGEGTQVAFGNKDAVDAGQQRFPRRGQPDVAPGLLKQP